MEYELGDYVKISKRWKKLKYPVFLENEKQYYDYCDKNDYDAGIPMNLMEKIPFYEQGYICGKRNRIKTFHQLEYEQPVDVGEGVVPGHFYTHSEEYEDMYLVATRMNCIYRVSKEDITLLKDVSV